MHDINHFKIKSVKILACCQRFASPGVSKWAREVKGLLFLSSARLADNMDLVDSKKHETQLRK